MGMRLPRMEDLPRFVDCTQFDQLESTRVWRGTHHCSACGSTEHEELEMLNGKYRRVGLVNRTR